MQPFLRWLETSRGFLVVTSVLAFGSAALRLVRITFPAERIFDEVYSPARAWKLLRGEEFFSVHPPLADLMHIPSLFVFGNTPFGWRIAPWLAGIFFIVGIAFLGYWLTGRRRIGILAAVLATLDSMLFVYGRTGLPDMMMLALLVWSLALFFLSCRVRHRRWAVVAALASGVLFGSLVSVKWHGLGGLGLVGAWLAIQMLLRRRHRAYRVPNISLWLYPIAFLVIPVATYVLWFLPILGWHGSPIQQWDAVVDWNQAAWTYHTDLTKDHPYGSAWWGWPLNTKPVLFFSDTVEGVRRVIRATGNHILWWSGAAAVLGVTLALFRRFRAVDAWLILAVLGFWFPWIFISRVTFLYHFLPSLVFEILLLAVILDRVLKHRALRPGVGIYLFAVVVWFLVLFPSITALVSPFRF